MKPLLKKKVRFSEYNSNPYLSVWVCVGLWLIITILFGSAHSSSAQDYIVGEGDVLKITVYEHDDLTMTVRVSGEGTIAFPLIGKVPVAGLTLTGIARKITVLLADGYIVNPQVNIFIHEFRSNKATVLGQINRPGLYELRQYTTLLEIISQAGGLTRGAGNKAIIKRKLPSGSDREEKSITIDLKNMIEGGDTSRNIQIMGGDSIYITAVAVYYVTGEVKKPDEFNLDGKISIIQAITKAGGFTEKAAPTKVKIIRKTADSKKVLSKVSMDEPVLPNDVIVVPESFF
ncbi:MAG: polysaccharide biosynthesis/export family protein [Thermodesulfobacteriota bacterium]|nr:polysaccharide biosynthesis/export family protein [Thermodesulfobacteriota bacterium]